MTPSSPFLSCPFSLTPTSPKVISAYHELLCSLGGPRPRPQPQEQVCRATPGNSAWTSSTTTPGSVWVPAPSWQPQSPSLRGLGLVRPLWLRAQRQDEGEHVCYKSPQKAKTHAFLYFCSLQTVTWSPFSCFPLVIRHSLPRSLDRDPILWTFHFRDDGHEKTNTKK